MPESASLQMAIERLKHLSQDSKLARAKAAASDPPTDAPKPNVVDKQTPATEGAHSKEQAELLAVSPSPTVGSSAPSFPEPKPTPGTTIPVLQPDEKLPSVTPAAVPDSPPTNSPMQDDTKHANATINDVATLGNALLTGLTSLLKQGTTMPSAPTAPAEPAAPTPPVTPVSPAAPATSVVASTPTSSPMDKSAALVEAVIKQAQLSADKLVQYLNELAAVKQAMDGGPPPEMMPPDGAVPPEAPPGAEGGAGITPDQMAAVLADLLTQYSPEDIIAVLQAIVGGGGGGEAPPEAPPAPPPEEMKASSVAQPTASTTKTSSEPSVSALVSSLVSRVSKLKPAQ